MGQDDTLYAAIVEQDGRKFLFWMEPEGDQIKLHQITPCRGIGMADVALTFTPVDGAAWSEIWAHFAKDDFARARASVLESIRPFEEAR